MAQKIFSLEAALYGHHCPMVRKVVALCKNLKGENSWTEVAATADCAKFLLRIQTFYTSLYLTSVCNYIVLSFFSP